MSILPTSQTSIIASARETVYIAEDVSRLHLLVSNEEVVRTYREGSDLVVVLTSGKEILVDGYFAKLEADGAPTLMVGSGEDGDVTVLKIGSEGEVIGSDSVALGRLEEMFGDAGGVDVIQGPGSESSALFGPDEFRWNSSTILFGGGAILGGYLIGSSGNEETTVTEIREVEAPLTYDGQDYDDVEALVAAIQAAGGTVPNVDLNGDGNNDVYFAGSSADSNNNNVPDALEDLLPSGATPSPNVDLNGDGDNDVYFDGSLADSDANGIPDALEDLLPSGATPSPNVDLNGDGDNDVYFAGSLADSDANGIPDALDDLLPSGPTPRPNVDLNGDGNFDVYFAGSTVDSDNNGTFDALEGLLPSGDAQDPNVDLNGDGDFDVYFAGSTLDSDNNGTFDALEGLFPSGDAPSPNFDVNLDGTNDFYYAGNTADENASGTPDELELYGVLSDSNFDGTGANDVNRLAAALMFERVTEINGDALQNLATVLGLLGVSTRMDYSAGDVINLSALVQESVERFSDGTVDVNIVGASADSLHLDFDTSENGMFDGTADKRVEIETRPVTGTADDFVAVSAEIDEDYDGTSFDPDQREEYINGTDDVRIGVDIDTSYDGTPSNFFADRLERYHYSDGELTNTQLVTRFDGNGNGIAERAAYDGNQNGTAERFAHDADENGTAERITYDADENGTAERTAHDADENGTVERIDYDADENGTAERYGYDQNSDGTLEFHHDADEDGTAERYTYDLNGDGVYEMTGYDEDEDGIPNLFEIDRDTNGTVEWRLYNSDEDIGLADLDGDGTDDIFNKIERQEGDVNQDGILEYLILDIDDNGSNDIQAYDSNGDGLIDTAVYRQDSSQTNPFDFSRPEVLEDTSLFVEIDRVVGYDDRGRQLLRAVDNSFDTTTEFGVEVKIPVYGTDDGVLMVDGTVDEGRVYSYEFANPVAYDGPVMIKVFQRDGDLGDTAVDAIVQGEVTGEFSTIREVDVDGDGITDLRADNVQVFNVMDPADLIAGLPGPSDWTTEEIQYRVIPDHGSQEPYSTLRVLPDVSVDALYSEEMYYDETGALRNSIVQSTSAHFVVPELLDADGTTDGTTNQIFAAYSYNPSGTDGGRTELPNDGLVNRIEYVFFDSTAENALPAGRWAESFAYMHSSPDGTTSLDSIEMSVYQYDAGGAEQLNRKELHHFVDGSVSRVEIDSVGTDGTGTADGTYDSEETLYYDAIQRVVYKAVDDHDIGTANDGSPDRIEFIGGLSHKFVPDDVTLEALAGIGSVKLAGNNANPALPALTGEDYNGATNFVISDAMLTVLANGETSYTLAIDGDANDVVAMSGVSRITSGQGATDAEGRVGYQGTDGIIYVAPDVTVEILA